MVAVEPDVLEALDQPLDPARVKMVKSRGGGMSPHLEAWDVKARANMIFGFDGWGPRLVELRHIGTDAITNRDGKEGWHVGYIAIVQVEVDGFPTRSDVGYGDATEYGPTAITCHELAAKEAASDALKRAMTSLGNQFGLELYDKTSAFRSGQRAKPDDRAIADVEEYAVGMSVDPVMLGRIARLVLRDKDAPIDALRRSDVQAMKLAIDYAASNPEDAEAQLAAWEASDGG